MKDIITKEYVKSDVYKNTLFKYFDERAHNPFLQEENVINFNYRVYKLRALGAWRWLSTYRHRDIICDYVFSTKKKGIDFGGHHAPIYGESEIIDIFPPNMYRKLEDIEDRELDYIYTSHTLEHTEDVDYIIGEFFRILKPNGVVLCIVPAFNCERWRKGDDRNTHCYTFSVSGRKYTRLDKKFQKARFILIASEYTYDNSIWILATKCVY